MRALAVRTMLAIVVCLSAARIVPAAEREPPCLADVKRLCADVPPTGTFVQGCLQAQPANLSPACRKHVDQLTRDGEALETACRPDLTKLCANAPLVAGARESCLVAHRDALSSKCRDTLDEQSNK